jgi:uncharacterized protein
VAKVVTVKQMSRIAEFARGKYAANDFNHNVDHMELTVRWARYLALAEKADVAVCVAAAYLHDIARCRAGGKPPVGGRHGPDGARVARVFLESIGVPKEFIQRVCYAVREHDSGSPKKSKEARVIWDADKIQSLGPFGLVRIMGHHLRYDTDDALTAYGLTMRRHRFFYERFYTRTGRRLAGRLHRFMAEFDVLLQSVSQCRLSKGGFC